MSQSRRQLALLAVLLVSFVYLAGRELLPTLRSAGAGAGGDDGDQSVGGAGFERRPVAELLVEELEHKPAAYKAGRNPFTFAPPPAPAAPPRPAAPPPPPPRPAATPQPTQTAPAPPRPQPPPVRFVYLGSFGPPGRQIAVFSEGQELFNAFEGDVLQEEFVVRRIGFESADVGFVNFPDSPPQRLAVGG